MVKTQEYTSQFLKASYLPQKDAQKLMSKYGYSYDPKLSRMDTKVFISPEGKPVIAHRGSKRITDWMDDALLGVGLGKYTHRYKNAQRVTKRAEEKYNNNADSLGHSLGGWLSEKSGNKGDIITYNKAVGYGDIGQHNKSNQIDYRTQGDLVSMLAPTQTGGTLTTIKNVHLFSNALNAHNTENLNKYLGYN